ncbi:MAG: hypothetical protein A3J46_02270 [Candidatus Yanofskybacteria bacterium RIFCSPHIGHO2_02_FULL_41_11]|uniref:TPM domain-containing protein n=1 Tax=Candidatus Yanofskybacteria bacterium RIFCSPHIGHO2_02_FULL_41_11 TaxID=1802675 RepID=A0A1F8F8T4_9BACT|nr:MAG: hypothetical protein A3J46_02270 [Candidatus Yanofskybacteria bacterium RIFCSPHIGHO2_02_FULL_41_11]
MELNNATNAAEENLVFTKAVIAGMNGLIEFFGDKPYAQRLEERRLAEQKAAEEDRLRAEQTKTFLMFAVPTVAVLAVLGLIIACIAAKRRREGYLKGLFVQNERDIQRAKEYLVKATNAQLEARSRLVVLIAQNPTKSAWEDISTAINEAPVKINELISLLEKLEESHQSSTWRQAENESKTVSALLATAVALAGLADLVKKREQEITEARSKSPELANQYSATEQSVIETLRHKDVKDSTRQLLSQAKGKYNEAVATMEFGDGVNWLGVYALLTSALALLNKAKSSAQVDKNAAEEARRPRPVYRSSPSHRSTYSGSRRSTSGFKVGGGGRFSGGGASRGFRK